MSQVKNKFLAPMATNTIKGNSSGSTSNPSDLTVSQVNTMLGLAPSAAGQVINSITSTTFDWSATPTLGSASVTGQLSLISGSGGGGTYATIQNNATTSGGGGSYNFNLPATAGLTGQPLLSGGGGSDAMTWGILSVQYGGTGITSGTSGGIPYYSSTSTIASSTQLNANQVVIGGGGGGAPSTLAAGTTYQVLYMNGSSPGWGAVALNQSAAISGTLPVGNGGTGQLTLTNHGVLIGAGTSGITSLTAAAAGTVLTGQGSTSDPSFSATPTFGVNGTTSGTLSLATDTTSGASITIQNGGGNTLGATTAYNFNLPITVGTAGQVLTSQGGGTSAMTWTSVLSNPMTTLGDTIYGGSSGSPTRLAGNTTSTREFLISAGVSSAATAPTWGALVSGDIPPNAANTSGTATYATNIAVTGTSTGAAFNVLFVSGSTTGNYGADVNSQFIVNPSTGVMFAQQFTAKGGAVNIEGTSSGDISILAQAASGTYNFNLPTTAGVAGQILTSQGGSATAMTWIYAPDSPWVSGYSYVAGNTVTYSELEYICVFSHTAGLNFEVDVYGGYWVLINTPQQNANLFLVSNNFENGGVGLWSSANSALSSPQALPTTVYTNNVPFGTQYTFTIPTGTTTTTAGTVYSSVNGANTYYYTVTTTHTVSVGTTLVTTGTGTPTSGAVLAIVTNLGGSGQASITTTGTATTANAASSHINAPSAQSNGAIDGVFSMEFSNSTSAGNVGDGYISQPFSIAPGEQGKMLTIRFNYSVSAGSTAPNMSGTTSNTYACAIYDLKNNAWINPQGAFNFIQTTGVGNFTGTFQTPINMTYFQVFIYNPTALPASSVLLLDDFYVGQQTAPTGPAMTDWVQYTPTFTNLSTPTNVNFQSRRVGSDLEIRGLWTMSANGAGATCNISLGYNGVNGGVTTAASPTLSSSGMIVGKGAGNASTTTNFSGFSVIVFNGGTNLYFGTEQSTQSGLVSQFGSEFLSGDEYSFFASVPIQGWSSNTSMSSDTDTRVVAMQVSQTSPTVSSFSYWNLIKYTSAPSQDTHGAYSTSTGGYTVPVTGFYHINIGLGISATYVNSSTAGVGFGLNSTSSPTYVTSQTAGAAEGTMNPSGSWTTYATAGTVIYPLCGTSGTGASVEASAPNNYFTVDRLSGPAVVAATESVNARYYSSSTSVSGSLANITYATKDFDSHNAYSSGTYTIPVSGKYQVNASILMTATTTAANELIQIQINHGGSAYSGPNDVYFTSSSSKPMTAVISDIINCSAGDTITIQASNGGSTPSISSSNSANYFSISRVGN
jgi:hypothetical protein